MGSGWSGVLQCVGHQGVGGGASWVFKGNSRGPGGGNAGGINVMCAACWNSMKTVGIPKKMLLA